MIEKFFETGLTPSGAVYVVHTMKTLDITEWATFVTLLGRGGHRKTATFFYPSMDDAIIGHQVICCVCQYGLNGLIERVFE